MDNIKQIVEFQKQLHPLAKVEVLQKTEEEFKIVIFLDDFCVIKRYRYLCNEEKYLFCEMDITPR
jgi:hypothetical protein